MADKVGEFIKNFRNMLKVTASADANRRTNEVGAGIARSMADKTGNPVEDYLSNQRLSQAYRVGNAISRDMSGRNIDPAEFITTTKQGGSYEDLIANNVAESQKEKAAANTNVANPAAQYTWGNTSSQSPIEDASDYIEYTYKRGDTFGQVIKDLGLTTKKGLWGSDGDVAYYTKQLREQGIPGMVPVGKTIRLRRRK